MGTVIGHAAAALIGAMALGQATPQRPPEQPAAAGAASGDEVVVVARRRGCGLQIADHILSDREFRARAAEWAAGRRLRIAVPPGSSYRCQAEILFRLHRYGVTLAEFVDQ